VTLWKKKKKMQGRQAPMRARQRGLLGALAFLVHNTLAFFSQDGCDFHARVLLKPKSEQIAAGVRAIRVLQTALDKNSTRVFRLLSNSKAASNSAPR
jgi:hypothetical protein